MTDHNEENSKQTSHSSKNEDTILKVIQTFKKDFDFNEPPQSCNLTFNDFFLNSTKYLDSTPYLFSINSNYSNSLQTISEFKYYILIVNQNNQLQFLKKFHYYLFFRLHFYFMQNKQNILLQTLLDECLPLIPEAKPVLDDEELYYHESLLIIQKRIKVSCTPEDSELINYFINQSFLSSFRPLFVSTISLELEIPLQVSNPNFFSLSDEHSQSSEINSDSDNTQYHELSQTHETIFNTVLEIYVKDSLFSRYTSDSGTSLLFTAFSHKNMSYPKLNIDNSVNNNINNNENSLNTHTFNNNIFVSQFDYFDQFSPRYNETKFETNIENNSSFPSLHFFSGSKILSDTLKQSKFIHKHSSPITSFSISQNSKLLLSTTLNGDLSISSQFLEHPTTKNIEGDVPIWASTFAPQGGSYLIGLNDNTAQLWYCFKIIRLFEGHHSPINDVKFHPNCAYVSTASLDHTVRLWDIRVPETVRLFLCEDAVDISSFHNFHHSGNCAFSHNGELIAFTDLSKIRIAQIADQKILQTITVPGSNERTLLSNLTFSLDDNFLYFLQDNSSIFCFDCLQSTITQIFSSNHNITSIEFKNQIIYVYSS